jgi:hypothetical protein
MRFVALTSLFFSVLLGACQDGEGEPAPGASPAVSHPVQAHYSNEWLKVELDYPADWIPVSGHEIGGMAGKFADPRGDAFGFFSVSTLGGEEVWTLDRAASLGADHKLKPFGDNPEITILNLPAGEARLIAPDPFSTQLRMAEVVIRYPVPINEGAISQPGLIIPVYYFFVLYGDVDNIERIAKTVRLGST